MKFRITIKKWSLVQSYERITDELDSLIKQISNRNDDKYYWDFYITDVLAISKFPGNNDYEVEVFSTLSKKRFEAIVQLEKDRME